MRRGMREPIRGSRDHPRLDSIHWAAAPDEGVAPSKEDNRIELRFDDLPQEITIQFAGTWAVFCQFSFTSADGFTEPGVGLSRNKEPVLPRLAVALIGGHVPLLSFFGVAAATTLLGARTSASSGKLNLLTGS